MPVSLRDARILRHQEKTAVEVEFLSGGDRHSRFFYFSATLPDMTVRTFLIGTATGAVLSSVVLALIIQYLDPEQAGPIGYVLFFLSLFLAVASSASLGGYGIRRSIAVPQFAAYTVRTSLRQGIIISVFTCLLLFLQLIRLYRWWLAILILIFCIVLELIFLSYDHAYARRSPGATD